MMMKVKTEPVMTTSAATTEIVKTIATMILRRLFLGGLLPLILFSLPLLTPSPVSAKNQLEINLRTDQPIYYPKSEIEFIETFTNIGNERIQIIDDECGYGSDLKVSNKANNAECRRLPCSAGHTLKPGLRPGVRRFINPKQSFVRKFSAYITTDKRLVFQKHGEAGFTGFSKSASKASDLPSKYFGCGQIFALDQSWGSRYEFIATYSNTGDWSTGEARPKEPLWQGHAESPPIFIDIKRGKGELMTNPSD
jgi:hypothetical protein